MESKIQINLEQKNIKSLLLIVIVVNYYVSMINLVSHLNHA